MAITNIKGRDVALYFQKPGDTDYTRIGCAESVGLSLATEEIETTCVASGNFKEFEPGDIDWSGSVDGAIRQATNVAAGGGGTPPAQTDADDNVTAEDLVALQLAGSTILMRFSLGVGVGSRRYEGKVFFTGNDLTGSRKDSGKFSAKFRGTGALTPAVVIA